MYKHFKYGKECSVRYSTINKKERKAYKWNEDRGWLPVQYARIATQVPKHEGTPVCKLELIVITGTLPYWESN